MDLKERIVLFLLLLLLSTNSVNKVDAFFEPITAGVAVGTALLTSALFTGYDFIICKLYECCEELAFNLTGAGSILVSPDNQRSPNCFKVDRIL